MDYQSLNSKATAVIASLGFPVTVTRAGVTVGKASAVVTPSTVDKAEGVVSSTVLALTSKTLYLTATQSFEPQVGDLVVSKVGQWQVVNVEAYKPSTTTICFKLEVQ